MAEIMEENVFCSIQVSGVVSCLCKLSESHLLDIIVIVYHFVVSILPLTKCHALDRTVSKSGAISHYYQDGPCIIIMHF